MSEDLNSESSASLEHSDAEDVTGRGISHPPEGMRLEEDLNNSSSGSGSFVNEEVHAEAPPRYGASAAKNLPSQIKIRFHSTLKEDLNSSSESEDESPEN